ncbi:FKBP-type peptidyl-prolyl cis-trans isomerase [Segetibacter aerophilus]|nr:FKBP-type peptidyl-prolyl cis-trans isomerase [Segetibacter aerophilus]
MRLLTLFFLMISVATRAADTDSIIHYNLPDTVRAVGMVTDVNIHPTGTKETYAGIGTKFIRLLVRKEKNDSYVSFQFPFTANVLTKGAKVEMEKGELEWKFNWQFNTPYKLMLSSAVDTADQFSIVSGYLYLPAQQKWKLIGTCKMKGETKPLIDLQAIRSTGRKSNISVAFTDIMVQRAAGSWKRLDDPSKAVPSPAVPFLSNIDSLYQWEEDKYIIELARTLGATKARDSIQGVYYQIIEPGNGKSISLTDSVTARYQLRLLGSRDVISGSETESYTFLLGTLIKGWQLAVPLVKTGGKLQIVIPSGLAYSIRTRAAKIPPNSVLMFDIQVLDTKPAAT